MYYSKMLPVPQSVSEELDGLINLEDENPTDESRKMEEKSPEQTHQPFMDLPDEYPWSSDERAAAESWLTAMVTQKNIDATLKVQDLILDFHPCREAFKKVGQVRRELKSEVRYYY